MKKILALIIAVFTPLKLVAYTSPDQIILLNSCTDHLASKISKVRGNGLRIMTYNLENLFDAKHDVGKSDFEYQPKVLVDENNRYISGPKVKFNYCINRNKKELAACPEAGDPAKICRENAKRRLARCFSSDWDEDDVELKLSQMEKSMGIQFRAGVLPDILVLVEIENPQIVTKFAKRIGMLDQSCTKDGICPDNPQMGLVMTNSPDQRGIDIAIVYRSSKLELVKSKTYNARSGGTRATRDIIEAHFLVDKNHHLFVYGNHWPSQRGPTWLRNNVALRLKEIIQTTMDQNPGSHVIATGDFNTTDGETGFRKHPFRDILLKGSPELEDLDQLSSIRSNPTSQRGSYYYPPNVAWNHLDKFFISKNLLKHQGLRIDLNSHVLHNQKKLVAEQSVDIYRDQNTVEQIEPRPRYYGTLKSVESKKVTDLFEEQNLDVLKVTEKCAPKRFRNYNDSSIFGYSDHFATSVVIRY